MRFRPHFSVRTLAIFMTLVGAYFGCWDLTKRYAVQPSTELLANLEASSGTTIPAAISPPTEYSPMPFVVRYAECGYFSENRHYYLWLFGPKIELPFVQKR